MARDNVRTGRVAENSDDTVSTHELNKKRDRATCIRQSPKQTSAPLNRSIAHDETMNDETKQQTKKRVLTKSPQHHQTQTERTLRPVQSGPVQSLLTLPNRHTYTIP